MAGNQNPSIAHKNVEVDKPGHMPRYEPWHGEAMGRDHLKYVCLHLQNWAQPRNTEGANIHIPVGVVCVYICVHLCLYIHVYTHIIVGR